MNRKRLHTLVVAGYLVAILALLPACDSSATGTGVTPIPAASPTSGSTATPVVPPTVPPLATDTPPAPAAPTDTPVPPTASAPAASATPASATPGDTQPPYLDDRSSPQALLLSYANAISRHEYLRAYGYWEPNTPASQLPPYAQFEQGYTDTAALQITVGTVSGDAGAGQLYYTVPATLMAHTTTGAIRTFVGCYTLHLSQPAVQGTPPFQPLAIRQAAVQQVENDADTAALMAQSCPAQGGNPSVPTPLAGNPTRIDATRYLDDRSTPDLVVGSFYNAINRHEYLRAYSYWEPSAASTQLSPFPQFEEGYTTTASVDLTLGTVSSDAGAGQLHYTVPFSLRATTTTGATQTFVGCYRLHLSQPAIQGTPPFQPLGITGATVQQVANDADIAPLLAQSCQ